MAESSMMYSDKEIKPRGDVLTTATGRPLGERLNVLTAGPRGPILLQDVEFLEELAHFNRERIPERVTNAKGVAAFGYFEVTQSEIQKYCKSVVFERVGKHTPIAVRFSTFNGQAGSVDTVRDLRGFAIKFYTEEGNWDLVGHNSPIFFIRDPFLFPSLVHSQRRNPQTNLKDADQYWDFVSLRPETLHQVTLLFGDRGIPDGYRHMNGYSGHAFTVVNRAEEMSFCKFHWKTDQGIRNLSDEKGANLSALSPDYATKDLVDAIQKRKYPSWTMYAQIMSMEQAQVWKANPFDVTKVWPHREFPLMEVGRVILDKCPENYFAEVEQLAFSPSNLIPGIDPSPDKVLQGRLFAYPDAHRHRLGVNVNNIPVNRPRCPLNTLTQRDGSFCLDNNHGSSPNYFPNSGCKANVAPKYRSKKKATLSAPLIDRFESGHEDNYSQVRVFWEKILEEEERKRLTLNMARSLVEAKEPIQQKIITLVDRVHKDYGEMLRSSLAVLKN